MNTNTYKALAIAVIAAATLGGGWYAMTRQQNVVSEEVLVQERESDTPAPTLQQNSVSKEPTITITSPNGGEVLRRGDTVSVTWNATNIPEDTELELELFEITGERPSLSAEGACLNCGESGLRSGVPYQQNVTNGVGSAEWEIGKLYRGGYVEPGTHYVMKVEIKKSGTPEQCDTGGKGLCYIMYEIDWSDRVFTLI